MAKTLMATVITACMCVISSFMIINSNRQELFAQNLDLSSATISDINKAFDDGTLTSERLVNLYLARIDSYENNDPNLNALITINEKVLEKARALDVERQSDGPRSLLHGIPVVLKDNVDTQDMPTTAGSKILRNFQPTYDSFVTNKLLNKGSIFLGKTNLDEFAMGSSTTTSFFGNTINPKSTPEKNLVPGGSSGGSAAAVSANLCLGATGTDTGGSIRQPASFCGVVGIKPTYGLCSRWGIIAFASSLDQAGPITKTVEDAAALFEIIAGHDPKDSTSSIKENESFFDNLNSSVKGMKIGIPREFKRSLNE